MAGNTSSSPNARSMGYLSNSSANNTVVNVYVDASSTNYDQINAIQTASINMEVSPGIATSINKTYQFVPTTPTPSGKYGFDALSPTSSSTTTTYQKVGSAVKLPQDPNSKNTPTKAIGVLPSTPYFSENPNITSSNRNQNKIPQPPQNPGDYDWNLPPHKWSLPLFANSDPANVPPRSNKKQSDDRYRRGRIWWRATDTTLNTVDTELNVSKIDNSDRKYGFQFLWNPTSFGTSVSVKMDATPQIQDRFLGTVGAFPATESITFTLRIDRINDFACANALFKRPNNIGADLGNLSSNSFITASQVAPFIKYYQNNGSFASALVKNGRKSKVETKLIDLFQRGTLADIEYIYRAINGAGPGSTASGADYWKNGRGIITADIGFLMPTLLNIDIGPLSYMGYVNNLNVTHNMFTPDMIPIQSDVTLSFQLLATAGLNSAIGG